MITYNIGADVIYDSTDVNRKVPNKRSADREYGEIK
jgi:hypothetical protein